MQIRMDKIRILPSFLACPPRAEKLRRKREYYATNGHYDRALAIDGHGWLVDGYATYLVMKENGESVAAAEIAQNIWPAVGCDDKHGKRDWYSIPLGLARKLRPGRRIVLFANGAIRVLQV